MVCQVTIGLSTGLDNYHLTLPALNMELEKTMPGVEEIPLNIKRTLSLQRQEPQTFDHILNSRTHPDNLELMLPVLTFLNIVGVHPTIIKTVQLGVASICSLDILKVI